VDTEGRSVCRPFGADGDLSPTPTINGAEPPTRQWRTLMATSPAPAASQVHAPAEPDLAALKSRQQGAWSSGDYAAVGTTLQIVGEDLCEALDIRAGQKVLDVAAGNGNVSLAAARRWCEVVATDYVPALLARARERAAAERLEMEFREADAEALPFQDASFDVVVSTFGVMFTPDQDKAAAELIRVCRPGGKIGLANWTPEGFIGQIFKTIGKQLPPPAGVRSPALWGTRARIDEMFEAKASSIRSESRNFVFRYRSPEHWLQFFKSCYGPVLKAYAALEPAAQAALTADILALIARFNRSGDAGVVVPGEYLEIVVTRR
jgi:ubiquinone/menaquinone biosynthesis C-methylase UbiE